MASRSFVPIRPVRVRLGPVRSVPPVLVPPILSVRTDRIGGTRTGGTDRTGPSRTRTGRIGTKLRDAIADRGEREAGGQRDQREAFCLRPRRRGSGSVGHGRLQSSARSAMDSPLKYVAGQRGRQRSFLSPSDHFGRTSRTLFSSCKRFRTLATSSLGRLVTASRTS